MKLFVNCFYEHGQYTIAEWIIDDAGEARPQNIYATSQDEFLHYIKEHDIKVVTINDFAFGVVLVNGEVYFDMSSQGDSVVAIQS